jgi:hypothetical protein
MTIILRNRLQPLPAERLAAISKVLADTETGLTGSRIDGLQRNSNIPERNGFMNLLKGLYGTIRDPLAHDPKVEWDVTEHDALDILTMILLVHRKPD